MHAPRTARLVLGVLLSHAREMPPRDARSDVRLIVARFRIRLPYWQPARNPTGLASSHLKPTATLARTFMLYTWKLFQLSQFELAITLTVTADMQTRVSLAQLG